MRVSGRQRPPPDPGKWSRYGWGRRLVQDVRVLRGAQPVAGSHRSGGPGHQLRLGKARHEAGAPQPEPDHRRGSFLRRSGLAVDHPLEQRRGGGPNTDSFSPETCSTSRSFPPALPTDIPYVVTSSLASGAPAVNNSYPIWNLGVSQPGVVANDPVSHPQAPVGAYNGMKAAFAQFLSLHHGGEPESTGTPLLFSTLPRAAVPFAQLPRHQLHGHAPATCHRPLPAYNPGASGYKSKTYTGDPGVRNPYINPLGTDQPRRPQHAGVYIANTTFAGWHALFNSADDQRLDALADPGTAAVPDSRRLHERRRRHLSAKAAHSDFDGQQRQRLRRPVHQRRPI